MVLLAASLALVAVVPSTAAGESYSIFSQLKNSRVKHRYLYSSLFTEHYDPDPDHVNDQNLLGLETQMENDRLWGFAFFDNSFGQDSQYLYVGRKFRAFGSDYWNFKLTGGLLHGYKEPYEDKIPLNDLGVAPAIIPGIGYQNKHVAVEFVQLGLAAGMVTFGFVF